jgi:hypothetical protein
LHIHKIWIANFACQRQSTCNLVPILNNGRLPGGRVLKMFLRGPNNICAGFGACIIKCTILPNFGFKKLHYSDRSLMSPSYQDGWCQISWIFTPHISRFKESFAERQKGKKNGIFKCELTYINLREYASALSSKLLSKKNDEDDINLKKYLARWS